MCHTNFRDVGYGIAIAAEGLTVQQQDPPAFRLAKHEEVFQGAPQKLRDS